MDLIPQSAEEVLQFAQSQGWISGTLVAAEPAGEGNMNRTLRLTTSDGSIVLKQATPFVAKYPHIGAPRNRDRIEAAFYRAVVNTSVAAQMPIFLGHASENHLLAFEDLGPSSDCTTAYVESNLGAKMPSLVTWLGALHQITAEPPDFNNREMRKLNHEYIFIQPFIAKDESRLQSKAKQLGELYLANTNGPLLHGDFFPGSWLSTPNGLRIIDPEFTFRGPVEFDLGVLLAHLVFAGSSFEILQNVLSYYDSGCIVDESLIRSFAGVEILRRLWGVAQLPTLPMDRASEWIETAKNIVLNP